jgi:hypothetical protein
VILNSLKQELKLEQLQKWWKYVTVQSRKAFKIAVTNRLEAETKTLKGEI